MQSYSLHTWADASTARHSERNKSKKEFQKSWQVYNAILRVVDDACQSMRPAHIASGDRQGV
eukprot:4211956-Amphidinium_carterae.1